MDSGVDTRVNKTVCTLADDSRSIHKTGMGKMQVILTCQNVGM